MLFIGYGGKKFHQTENHNHDYVCLQKQQLVIQDLGPKSKVQMGLMNHD